MEKLNPTVTHFLDSLHHPYRAEIELLREMILTAVEGITENIKWNAPNYVFEGNDRITMRILPPKQVQLIFHRGAQKLAPLQTKPISVQAKFWEWKENDRGVMTFHNLEQITTHQAEIASIAKEWIETVR